jgi:hypothetical protein
VQNQSQSHGLKERLSKLRVFYPVNWLRFMKMRPNPKTDQVSLEADTQRTEMERAEKPPSKIAGFKDSSSSIATTKANRQN